jgi:hypothetical protein
MQVPAGADVVWVKVEKPVFDLWGVLVSSLTFTGLLALGTLLLGCLLALAYILRGRHFGSEPQAPLGLDLTVDAR